MVAIIGILASVGVVTYSGYISGTKEKSAKNVMQQISLAQTEEYSNSGNYYTQDNDSCTPSSSTSNDIETILFGGGDQIGKDMDKTDEVKEAIFPVIDSGKNVALNLSNVQYMDSSGISVLIESHQKALEKGTKLVIKDVSKSVLKVIMMAKLEQILNLE